MRSFLFLGLALAGIATSIAILVQGSRGLANPYPSPATGTATRALNRTYGTMAWPTPYVTQPQPTPGSTPSGPRPPQGEVAGPRRVDARNLSPAPKVESRSGQPRLIPRLAPELKRDPRAQPPQANALDRASAGMSTSGSAPDIVSGFEGLGSTDNAFGLSPPDPQIAVGPNHVVEFVNVTGRIYTKAGVPVSTFSLDDFFGVFPGASSSDPKVIYDDVNHRFFASFIDLDFGANFGDLFLAISETDDPTGAWNQYVASFSGAVPDYPGIGVTDDKFTLSYNLFSLSSFNFIGQQTLVVQKSDVMAGAPSPGAFFFPVNANRFTVRPAHSLSSTNDQYLTTFDILSNGGSLPLTEMTVIRITGTPDNGDVTEASATDLPVLTQDSPPSSVTAGPGYIDSGDFRMLEAVWRDNSLWSSASAACVPPGDGATRSCAHLIEVATVGSPSMVQDIMFGAFNQYYSWPAIRTDGSANLYVSFTGAHSGMFASAQVAGRLSTDPLGTINGSCLLKAGQVAHSSGRWGDYLGAAVDPADPSTVWVVSEYAKNDGFVNWGTYIGSLSYTTGGTCPQKPFPPTPTPTPTPAPAKGNDNFTAAVVIPEPLPFTNAQNTAGSTTEPGEPSPCGAIAATVWYRFTPSSNQTLVADTFGSNYDTVLAVYTGLSLGALSLVGCNDQFGGNQSQVQFSAATGTTYYIQAGGYFGQTGTLVLNLAPPPPPPANDDFADAIAIPEPLSYTNTQSTAGATIEAGEPSPCGGIAATVWYRFTPSSNQTLVADTFGSNYSTELAVYTGPDLSNLTLVGCNYSRVRFTAAAGITYYFQAGGYFGQTGNLTFNLTNGPIPLPTPSPTPTPTCPTVPTFSFSVPDPTGDAFGFGLPNHDITNVSGEGDASSFCLTVDFAGPVDPADAGTGQEVVGVIEFDTDQSASTGSSPFMDSFCRDPSGMGVEASLSMFSVSGGLGLLNGNPVPVVFGTTSFTAIIPLSLIGGDTAFNFGMMLGSRAEPTDCAPAAGGCIMSPTGDVCSVPATTPSPTPPPTNTPTPGPTPTPCPTECALDFSIGTDLLSGAGGACSSSGTPTNVCNVPLGAKFNVNVYLNSLPPALVDGYAGYQATLDYTGLTATETQQSMHLNYWPDCGVAYAFFYPGEVVALCVHGVNDPSSTYTGRMAAPEFTCTADGAITLVHGQPTEIITDAFDEFWEDSDESLTIHCVAPLAYPGDTDGDGCPDTKEMQTALGSEHSGGRRSFLNPSDYFNPTHDAHNGVDDIMLVAAHYGKNTGDAGYSTDYDRMYIGPNAWNLGPPNGQIRVDDVLLQLRQYNHDCA